jgi:hypothetical protein
MDFKWQKWTLSDKPYTSGDEVRNHFKWQQVAFTFRKMTKSVALSNNSHFWEFTLSDKEMDFKWQEMDFK